MLDGIKKFDNRVSESWTNHRFAPAVEKLLKFYVRLGDGYGWAVFIALVIWQAGWIKFFEALDHALVALVAALLIYFPLKNISKRPRPFAANPKIRADVPPLDKYSFPSGHTMNNLAVATSVFFVIPHLGWIMLLLPLTWGLLRVYYGVHWLTDVLCGFCLGIVSYFVGCGIWAAVTHFTGMPFRESLINLFV
ncbi:phosphatase PAP2 family protein [Fibrobacter sp. UWEL]|uniref:phosphatase PAP2 family protein n=1 Tax=Fibrobacter sp. UWEL TaxID=1896209 RepID=UPI000915721E|nr:phosphatase PAP2 family protein [Fibrobacter sp. UWEL]SHL35061.1 undecaprenyl-diphosphatase [Fibrobacter sp. UWEL]